MESSGYISLLPIFLWFLLSNSSYASPLDVECLKSLKKSLNDPAGCLKMWSFQNATEGFICKYIGVECWHPNENKVLNLNLSNMGLGGEFPLGLENCTSLIGLDLSNNNLTGSLPADISKKIPFVTNLDLSLNSFTGDIPINLSDCSYLDTINLQQNHLSGTIPWQLTLLGRLTSINVSNNQLSGTIPAFKFSTAAPSFAYNLGLCGTPLEACNRPSKRDNTGFIIGSCVAGVIVSILIIGVIAYFILHRFTFKNKKKEGLEEKWVKILKASKGTKVSMFKKSASKMKLGDLISATNAFNKDNVIGTERTGTIYKATLPDGSHFAIKRLKESHSQLSQRVFESKIKYLYYLEHVNLVALLGFCIARKERFLIYKHVPNGNLYDLLHPPDSGRNSLDWLLRLKISIGVANGLACIHLIANFWHRKISSKCILLEYDYVPKISDFGLDWLMDPVDNHFSTFINGEFGDHGYVAPEYACTLRFTPAVDVYSFGVVLLELITGERPTHVSVAPERFKDSLVKWIAYLSSRSRLHDAIDKSLIGKGHDSEILNVLNIACSCVLPAPEGRPKMDEIYKFLEAIGESYHFCVDDDALAQSPSVGGVDELIVAE